MSKHRGVASVELGDIDPAGSRHQGRRSAVALTDGAIVAGTAAGAVRAFDRTSLDERWQYEGEESVVAAVPVRDCIATGTRGARGRIRLHDAATGEVRWQHEAAHDVGVPQKDTRFLQPFVAALETDKDHVYAAARRYERGKDGSRNFQSIVYAFDLDGSIAWQYETDASPIALDVDDDRIAVAYNRCSGDHQHGLIVLAAEAGTPRWQWDPGTDGQRRVGDVALLDDGAIVSSHGDYCGYRLGSNGGELWRVELATKRRIDGETVYAYPNHVHATGEGAAFVTGNTYPEEGRETDARHPREHSAIGISSEGDVSWEASIGGFASGIATAGSGLAVPGAQNFRDRDPDDHGLCVLDVADGVASAVSTDGVPTAAALDDETVVWVEEPIVYHDEGTVRGAYRLHRRAVE